MVTFSILMYLILKFLKYQFHLFAILVETILMGPQFYIILINKK